MVMSKISPEAAQEACEALLFAGTPEQWCNYLLNLQTWLIGNGFFDGLDSESLEEHALYFQQLQLCFKYLRK
jgi:hypothetical protein